MFFLSLKVIIRTKWCGIFLKTNLLSTTSIKRDIDLTWGAGEFSAKSHSPLLRYCAFPQSLIHSPCLPAWWLRQLNKRLFLHTVIHSGHLLFSEDHETQGPCFILHELHMDKTSLLPVMSARAWFHLRKVFYLTSCFYLLRKLTPGHTLTHTLVADPNEVPKYGEQKVRRGVKGEAEQKTNK